MTIRLLSQLLLFYCFLVLIHGIERPTRQLQQKPSTPSPAPANWTIVDIKATNNNSTKSPTEGIKPLPDENVTSSKIFALGMTHSIFYGFLVLLLCMIALLCLVIAHFCVGQSKMHQFNYNKRDQPEERRTSKDSYEDATTPLPHRNMRKRQSTLMYFQEDSGDIIDDQLDEEVVNPYYSTSNRYKENGTEMESITDYDIEGNSTFLSSIRDSQDSIESCILTEKENLSNSDYHDDLIYDDSDQFSEISSVASLESSIDSHHITIDEKMSVTSLESEYLEYRHSSSNMSRRNRKMSSIDSMAYSVVSSIDSRSTWQE